MEEQQKTSMGLEQYVAGLLSYVLLWVTGLIFFFAEQDNKFVKFHAMQSILTFGALHIVQLILLPLVQLIFRVILWRAAGLYSVYLIFSGLFTALSWIIGIATFALWIVLMIKAYQNETFKLPIAGKIAEKQLQ